MWFRKKKSQENSLTENLRRKFHLMLISRRRGNTVDKNLIHLKRSSRGGRRSMQPGALRQFARFFFRPLFLLFTIAIVGLFFLYGMLFADWFIVQKLNVEKDGTAVAANELSPFLERLRGKNILFLDTEQIEAEMTQTFKNQLLLVNIKKSYPRSIKVVLNEFPPVLNLHVVTPDGTQKLVINQAGFAIFENSELAELPILSLKTGVKYKAHTIVIPKEKLDPIVEAYQKFADLFGMKIISGEWKKVERELHLVTEKNFTIWIDLTQPIDQQFSKLKRALVKLDIYRTPLEYIDLRIQSGDNEKVIFKRK